MFGKNCQYNFACYNHATCKTDTGECRCQTGWTGETCTDCDGSIVFPSGRKFCTDRCLHCFNGDLCDINVPGDCDCTPGWIGSKCNESIPVTCDARFHSDICRNQSDCDDHHDCNNKTCECDTCIKGYRGEQCNMPCEYVLGQPDCQDSHQSTTNHIQDSGHRKRGHIDYIGKHLPLIIGSGLFLVLLIIIIVITSVICYRRRKNTVNMRNVSEAARRTDTLEMFDFPNYCDIADVGVTVTTFLNDRQPTNLQNGDNESHKDEDNRNRISVRANVDQKRKEKELAVSHPQYSETTVNSETLTDQYHNAPKEDVHYYTLEEDDVQ
ncbi:multiple epidermal growth factor-like domains protein 10 [Ptychodera flava]|uniref:multiple epidermal growth factor-like domains protein 10 n=1 Tax=Ptychodera flava TaxID=63121 RepID=UPI00396A62F2